jgi:polyisoprenoid-binding protein YceI
MAMPDAASSAAEATADIWRLDPTRSAVEFWAPTAWGLMTVKGRFERFDGTLDLRSETVRLTVEADSLDTKIAARDRHLRSADFFDVERHPVVQFVSDRVERRDGLLRVGGRLHAAGQSVPLELDVRLRDVDGELEIDAVTHVDHRELGMTASPLRMIRAPSKALVQGILVPAGAEFSVSRPTSDEVVGAT